MKNNVTNQTPSYHPPCVHKANFTFKVEPTQHGTRTIKVLG